MKTCLLLVCMVGATTAANFVKQREDILKSERTQSIGGGLVLNHKEQELNKVLLSLKRKEYEVALQNSSTFTPRLHFFDAQPKIAQSDLFSFIKKLPKGGSLHTHITASVSLDYLMTYIARADNLYANHINGVFKLKFFNESDPKLTEGWQNVTELLAQPNYKDYLKSHLTLTVPNHADVYPDIETIWKIFMTKFSATYDMYSYKPFLENVVHRILEEFLEDNVCYVEFRAANMMLYDESGPINDTQRFFEVLQDVITKFKSENPKFLGARIILSPSRRLDDEGLTQQLQLYQQLKSKFPNLIGGFDLIGYEELGRPLLELAPTFEKFKIDNFYFHAGETNWFGTSTDLNVLDAVLMGSKRIGHAFSLVKHPDVVKLVKSKNIAVEVMPISNQVLKLVSDLRNHPGAVLMAQGVPTVICNDDPTFWVATGLSYDFYLAFLGMSNIDSGLEFLKQLAINSIKYSSMTDADKKIAMTHWNNSWNKFIDDMIAENNIII